MGMKVATTCLHWTQPSVPHSPSSSPQTLASAISSPSKRRRSLNNELTCHRSSLFGNQSSSSRLYRSRSYEQLKPSTKICRSASIASLDSFSDEEFSKQIQELAMRFQMSDDDENQSTKVIAESEEEGCDNTGVVSDFVFLDNMKPFDVLEPPSNWPERDDLIPASIERRANSVDLPLSLRILKRKMKLQDGFREAGGSACSSIKKAFSSMVFIIQELQSYTMHMREMLFYEDLQGILVRVQKEMNASFVWLFQQVFSQTPTLMVYVMILLANFSVHSMSSSFALAATHPPPAISALEETFAEQKFDSSTVKTFSVSSSSGKSATVGGNNGGGGNYRSIASGTDGDGRSDEHRTIISDGVSQIGNATSTSEEEEELRLWNSFINEASRMEAEFRDEALDHETTLRFVSPIHAKIESDDNEDYFRTEVLYQTGIAQEQNNPMLLANYAQFLYLVAQDYDRAEKYFKKAVEVEPKDAEALNKYATFLWQVRKDLLAAEETFLEASDIEPENAVYKANYAHFLWNTGAEDTCFPV